MLKTYSWKPSWIMIHGHLLYHWYPIEKWKRESVNSWWSDQALIMMILATGKQPRSPPSCCEVEPLRLPRPWLCRRLLSFVIFSYIKLRYESSNLIIYKELSSTIFQSCLSGIGNTCPDLHFVQYIKAWMPSTDPLSSITNCYRLIVSYTDPVHSFTIS